jgi:N-acetylmuramic acid 6-phosphate etherase
MKTSSACSDLTIKKVKSPLHPQATVDEFIRALDELISMFDLNFKKISGLGISTAGIVDYGGSRILRASDHLNVLKNDSWKKEVEKRTKCTATLINDADAATIGLCEAGFLRGNKTIGVMPVGTGLGFSVWRNGRRWRPGKSFCLLGSISTPAGNYESIASASELASKDQNNDLINILTDKRYYSDLELYIGNLVKILNTATILYGLDEIYLCGGLADAAHASEYGLESILNSKLAETPSELDKPVKVFVPEAGNRLQLIGALALAEAETYAKKTTTKLSYINIYTEHPYNRDLQFHKMDSCSLVRTFWQAEQEAGQELENSLKVIADIVEESLARVTSGGRIIYVGAGTSGRIAAMDAVEIPCTYGFPGERVIAVIAGGVADAAIEIESEFEEDASSVPEMLLLNIDERDIVIGITASGSSYFVQSALAFAKKRKALTALIMAELPEIELPFCQYVIPLNSGLELIAGSTRMKAGTSTKKVLNFLSSSIMIRMGKVAGSYMIDVACINNKLVERAQSILSILYNIDKEDALNILASSGMNLKLAINKLETGKTN